MKAADIGPIPPEERTQSAFDLFLIWAGADIVATTLLTGAALVPAFSAAEALVLIAVGSLLGALLIAALVPLGARLGVPSVIAARAALGIRGASLLALFLYVSNFAWIALNNVIAASACARVAGGAGSERAWAVLLGLVTTAVVAAGPRAVGLADRAAVPLMLAIGVLLTVRCLGLSGAEIGTAGTGGMSRLRGLDIVVGYQASWILMFADYSRYTRSPTRGAVAVFLGLGLTSLWFMSVGALAARAFGSGDPAAMVAGTGLGAAGAVLLALATITTNFVNIYLSALAWKSLFPRASDSASIWSIGLVGSALGLFSRGWLDRYADFMLVLGGLFVPVGGVFLSRFFLVHEAVDGPALYEPEGRYRGFDRPGLGACALGAAAYFLARDWGGTLPSILVAMLAYRLLRR